MFRCPHCAQAHTMELELRNKNALLVLNPPMTELSLVVGSEEIAHDHPEFMGYAKALQDIDIKTPIQCNECHEEDTLENFIKCSKSPIMFHECYNLCHCGGEMYMDVIPHTTRYAMVCEREGCNWVDEKNIINGAEGD